MIWTVVVLAVLVVWAVAGALAVGLLNGSRMERRQHHGFYDVVDWEWRSLVAFCAGLVGFWFVWKKVSSPCPACARTHKGFRLVVGRRSA